MYPLITFSYEEYLLGEPILDKQQFYEYVLQGTIFMSMCDQNILNLSASYVENVLNCYASELVLNFLTIRVA